MRDEKRFLIFLKALFVVQAIVNLVGSLGPELSFDALWYHLPIARFIAEHGWWGVIPGGLLYMSGTPRLMEFVNAGLLWAGRFLQVGSPEVLVKLAHWGFGLASARMIFVIARRYWKKTTAWAAALVWYSSLVVGWQSMVAYVDLTRTFLVLCAVWFVLEAVEKSKARGWVWGGLFFGLAYSVKMLSGFDAILVLGLLFLVLRRHGKGIVAAAAVAGLFGFFWGLLNVAYGYHFFYPFYGIVAYLPAQFSLTQNHVLSPLYVFWHPAFRTGPVVLILLFLAWKPFRKHTSAAFRLVALGLVLSWWFAPANLFKGHGRYFLPSLATLAVLASGAFERTKGTMRTLAIALVLFSGVFGIFYRGYANLKFVPYVLGRETKAAFLATYLEFENNEWYDVDGSVSALVGSERYLVVGVHNAYYLPGNFDHESWQDTTYCYPYVLVQGERTAGEDWEAVYENTLTRSILYLQRSCW